jgi:hypothetical protein
MPLRIQAQQVDLAVKFEAKPALKPIVYRVYTNKAPGLAKQIMLPLLKKHINVKRSPSPTSKTQ